MKNGPASTRQAVSRTSLSILLFINGRGDWIRTSDLLLPKQALYRAKLRPADLLTQPRR
jgi:hypothetical protein